MLSLTNYQQSRKAVLMVIAQSWHLIGAIYP